MINSYEYFKVITAAWILQLLGDTSEMLLLKLFGTRMNIPFLARPLSWDSFTAGLIIG